MTDAPDKPYLLVSHLNQLVSSVHQSVWGLQTTESLPNILDPYFLGRCFADSVMAGDHVMFSCGPEGAARIHGTLVVTNVVRAALGQFGEVYMATLVSTAPPRARLKVVG